MTALIHCLVSGLVSGLIWSAILGTCMITIAAVITAMVPETALVQSNIAETTRGRDGSPIPATVRMGRTAILHARSPGPRLSRPSLRSPAAYKDKAQHPQISGLYSLTR
jgi:hypothetical protein